MYVGVECWVRCGCIIDHKLVLELGKGIFVGVAVHELRQDGLAALASVCDDADAALTMLHLYQRCI